MRRFRAASWCLIPLMAVCSTTRAEMESWERRVIQMVRPALNAPRVHKLAGTVWETTVAKGKKGGKRKVFHHRKRSDAVKEIELVLDLDKKPVDYGDLKDGSLSSLLMRLADSRDKGNKAIPMYKRLLLGNFRLGDRLERLAQSTLDGYAKTVAMRRIKSAKSDLFGDKDWHFNTVVRSQIPNNKVLVVRHREKASMTYKTMMNNSKVLKPVNINEDMCVVVRLQDTRFRSLMDPWVSMESTPRPALQSFKASLRTMVRSLQRKLRKKLGEEAKNLKLSAALLVKEAVKFYQGLGKAHDKTLMADKMMALYKKVVARSALEDKFGARYTVDEGACNALAEVHRLCH